MWRNDNLVHTAIIRGGNTNVASRPVQEPGLCIFKSLKYSLCEYSNDNLGCRVDLTSEKKCTVTNAKMVVPW